MHSKIEDLIVLLSTYNDVQVDFANRRIGGHALAKGLVQEEIRFMICPELIVSILLADAMEKDDCIVITGAEMYSNYTGYGSTYKFTGAKTDELPRDELMRKMTQIVAMDALPYTRGRNKYLDQFTAEFINRDLQKAFIAFNSTNPHAGIATGNWGCGAFGGNSQLKVIVILEHFL